MHLIREFAPDAYEFALASWSWIGTGDKTPRFASCFGDMFLESLDGWWFLDTVEGTLERRWSSRDAMLADLDGNDGRAEYLLEETLNTAFGQGLRLEDDEVFAFLPPPAVTGTMTVGSLAPLRFAIAANLAGRIHGELNGVRPDAGASALFAAQRFATENIATSRPAGGESGGAPVYAAPDPSAAPWHPTAEQVGTGTYPSYRPAFPLGHGAARPESAGDESAGYESAGYGTQYAAGSELDYGSSREPFRGPRHESGSYAAPAAHAAPPAPVGTHAAPVGPRYAGQGDQGRPDGYDYVDSEHTVDSGQFSQYIADQYNTGQVSAVGYEAPAPVWPRPRQDGHWSYA